MCGGGELLSCGKASCFKISTFDVVFVMCVWELCVGFGSVSQARGEEATSPSRSDVLLEVHRVPRREALVPALGAGGELALALGLGFQVSAKEIKELLPTQVKQKLKVCSPT